jgi:Tfp pilus assembly protein FimV
MFDQALDTEQTFAHPDAMERTYVRRRRTVAVVATALVAVLMSPLAAGAVRRGEPSAPAAQQVPAQVPAQVPGQVVVVQAGDTLWSIAQRIRPGDDPREVAAQIAAVNGVQPGALTVGASLVVPLD